MIFARGSSSTAVEAAPLGWVPSAFVVALVFLFIAACFGGLVWCWFKAGADSEPLPQRPLLPPVEDDDEWRIESQTQEGTQ